MKKILIIICIGMSLFACLPPLKPLPPIGCSYGDAVLIRSGNSCFWQYQGC